MDARVVWRECHRQFLIPRGELDKLSREEKRELRITMEALIEAKTDQTRAQTREAVARILARNKITSTYVYMRANQRAYTRHVLLEERKVQREHMEQAIADLQERFGFPYISRGNVDPVKRNITVGPWILHYDVSGQVVGWELRHVDAMDIVEQLPDGNMGRAMHEIERKIRERRAQAASEESGPGESNDGDQTEPGERSPGSEEGDAA